MRTDFEESLESLTETLSQLDEIQMSVHLTRRYIESMGKEMREEASILTDLYAVIRRPGFIDELCGRPIERSTEMDKLARSLEDIVRMRQGYWVRTPGKPAKGSK